MKTCMFRSKSLLDERMATSNHPGQQCLYQPRHASMLNLDRWDTAFPVSKHRAILHSCVCVCCVCCMCMCVCTRTYLCCKNLYKIKQKRWVWVTAECLALHMTYNPHLYSKSQGPWWKGRKKLFLSCGHSLAVVNELRSSGYLYKTGPINRLLLVWKGPKVPSVPGQLTGN